MKLHKQLINVKEYIQDVVSRIAAEAREKGIIMKFKRGFGSELSDGNDDGSYVNTSLRKWAQFGSKKSKKVSRQLSGVAQLLGLGKGDRSSVQRSINSAQPSVGSKVSHGKKSGKNQR